MVAALFVRPRVDWPNASRLLGLVPAGPVPLRAQRGARIQWGLGAGARRKDRSQEQRRLALRR